MRIPWWWQHSLSFYIFPLQEYFSSLEESQLILWEAISSLASKEVNAFHLKLLIDLWRLNVSHTKQIEGWIHSSFSFVDGFTLMESNWTWNYLTLTLYLRPVIGFYNQIRHT
jgi:hypothetical protein